MNRFLALLLFPLIAFGAPWDGILAPERAIDWTTTGIPGGIPNRTQVCATVTPGMSNAQIVSAIDNCPQNQVVQFTAGTFNLGGGIGTRNAVRRITIRGAGPTQTFLTGGSIVIGHWQSGGWPQNGHPINWTGGLARGSTLLTMASTSGIVAGQTVILSERKAATPWVFTTGQQGEQCWGLLEAPAWFWGSCTPQRPNLQMNKVVAVCTGSGAPNASCQSSNQIVVADPVGYTHTADPSCSSTCPQVFWWDTSGVGTENKDYIGVENLSIQSGAIAYTIDIAYCDYCWVKNVAVPDMQVRGAIRAYWSYGFEIRNNYIASNQPDNTTMYGIEIIQSSRGLVENNIAFHITNPYMTETTYGIVFAYNFHEKMQPNGGPCPTCMYADSQPHASHSMFMLFEGNTWGVLDVDNVWGSSSHGTVLRNRFDGSQPGKTSYLRALEISAHQRFYHAIGNVLGDVSIATQYRCRYPTDPSAMRAIYDLGEWHGCAGPEDTGTYDATTYNSLMRWGNWDAVTYKANGNTNGIRYCTGSGLGNTSCTEDERGSDTTFPPIAVTSTTIPPSFYIAGVGAHASCGTGIAFWKNPTSGTCPAFPPIGPDVNCTTNCQANVAGHAAKIPAQLCYEQTAKSADGHLTAFDATACYSPDTGIKPTPPTGVVVH